MAFDGKNLSKVKNWLLPFSALFVILAYLSFVTLRPLLQAISWAVLLAFLSYPMYSFLNDRFCKGKHSNICAAIMTIFIIFVIIAPTIIVGLVMAKEAVDLYTRYQPILRTTPFPIDEILPPAIINIIDEYPALLEMILETTRSINSYGFRVARGFLGNTIGLIYNLLVIFISYFFLIRDGNTILNYVKDIVPLVEEEQMKFMNRGNDTLRGVVYGVTLTAIIQGILGAIGWWIVDLPSPFLFGALIAVIAVIPLIGASIVWFPGVICLFIAGEYTNAFLLFLWGSCVVSVIDTFIRPKFISERANISTFLVFMGAVGGLMTWGFLGLFLGPLILSLSAFFLDNYREIWKLSLSLKSEKPETKILN